eukprot:137125-Amorphochlora_amoeboformis.AAC.1
MVPRVFDSANKLEALNGLAFKIVMRNDNIKEEYNKEEMKKMRQRDRDLEEILDVLERQKAHIHIQASMMMQNKIPDRVASLDRLIVRIVR